MGSSKAESASATYVNARPERSNLIVCGVGGSGTRAVVQALQALDPREQLEDRNEADDTLAATLLFKHRCALEHYTPYHRCRDGNRGLYGSRIRISSRSQGERFLRRRVVQA